MTYIVTLAAAPAIAFLRSTLLYAYEQISSVSQPGEIPVIPPKFARIGRKFFIPLRHILESSKKNFPLLFSTSPEKLLDSSS